MMARLAAIEKGEYYPTPLSVMDHIASYLVPAKGQRGVIRLFDPCAGEGLALEALAKAVAPRTNRPVQTWGVEISPDRAAQAAQRLDLVIEAPLEAVAWSPVRHGVASVLYLNSPYDQNGAGGRMEFDFLKMGLSSLVKDGVLVYVIPTSAVNYKMAQYLVQHFWDIRIFRFGDEPGPAGFDAFKQIVVLGVKRRESLRQGEVYTPQHYDVVKDLVEGCDERYSYRRSDRSVRETLPTALPEGVLYDVPVARKSARLRRYRYTEPELDDLVARTWPTVEAQMAGALLASDSELPQPLMPPKVGHIAQIVAAGLAGLIDVGNEVFKGRVVKTQVEIPDPEDDAKIVVRDRYDTHVVVVAPDGLEHLSVPSQVEGFLQEHIEVFKEYITANFCPYGNTVTPEEERILDTLSLDKRLPGVAKRGLLPKQREVAVALTRSIERYGVGHLIGEMGVGKTRTSLASVELMDSYPALVICPPHLVNKWKREIEAAVPGARAHIVGSIGELEELRTRYERGQKLVAVVSRSRIKMGPGWFKTSGVRYTLSKERDEREPFRRCLRAYRELRTAYLAEPSAEL
ncbi:MAG: DEAD/DEAH box helicase, partial [bacterium]|nr:DEAD/DEAH box helicase [bacterium]